MRKLLAVLAFLFLLLSTAYVEAANRFAVCTVTCTWDGSSTAMWSSSTGGSTGASVPGTSDDVILDAATCVGGVTCTITVNTTVTVLSITMGACTATTTGCILDFSANNNNVTLSAAAAFSGTGTGTRNLKMGNGTWTFSSTLGNSIWDMTTTTNLTFAANSSTLAFTGNTAATVTRTFNGGALTYNTISISASSGPFSMGGINTIGTLNLTGPQYLSLAASQTITTFNATGSSGNVVTIISSSVTVARTLTVTTPTLTWVAIRSITMTATASNCFGLGGLTNITCTPPASGGGGIIGGWLLRRDLAPANDNSPTFLNVAA